MTMWFEKNPLEDLYRLQLLRYPLTCDGRPVNESCLNDISYEILKRSDYVLENFFFLKINKALLDSSISSKKHHWFEEITSRQVQRICQKIAYAFSKEERKGRLNSVRHAFESGLENEDVTVYFTKALYELCAKNKIKRTYEDYCTIMRAVLMRSYLTADVQDMFDVRRYITYALRDKNKFVQKDDNCEGLSEKDKLQIILVCGFLLNEDESMIINDSSEEEIIKKYLTLPGRQTLIRDCNYITLKSFDKLLDIIERNIVDQINQYLADIYSLVDEYIEKFLHFIGIFHQNGKVIYRHDLRPENLKFIEELFNYKKTQEEKDWERFDIRIKGDIIWPNPQKIQSKKKSNPN